MSDLATQRLHAQRLIGEPSQSAVEIVRWLGAVQSQDYGGAKWALAQRTRETVDTELDRLFDDGAIVRTHVMRPTWHFVLPEDIRWLQQLTGPRVMAGLAGRHRQLELDDHTIARACDAFGEALTGGRFLSRPQLGEVLVAAGISPEGQRLPHLLGAAENRGLIVSGPRRGNQFTYALLDERVPTARDRDRDEALAELTLRYFRSHGPAQPQDFAWWSGLTLSDVRKGIAAAGAALQRQSRNGKDYWVDADVPVHDRPPASAHLLPNFDEFTVAYRDRAAVLHPEFEFDPTVFAYFRDLSALSGVLSNVVLVGGRVFGAWRRTLAAQAVSVEVRLLGPLGPAETAAVEQAGRRLGKFLQRTVELRFS